MLETLGNLLLKCDHSIISKPTSKLQWKALLSLQFPLELWDQRWWVCSKEGNNLWELLQHKFMENQKRIVSKLIVLVKTKFILLILWYGMVCRRLPELKVPSLYFFSLHQQFLWGPNPFQDEHIGEVLKVCFPPLGIRCDGKGVHCDITITWPIEKLGVLL